MNGMILHCGAESLNRDELARLPLPAPMGPRHVVRPFINDVELVSEALADNGLTVIDEGYGVKTSPTTGLPTQFFGLMEMQAEAGDFALMVGIRGSYDQRLPRGLAIGSRVFVCDNLAFSGEITVRTKQTTHVDARIEGLLRDAVAQVPGMAEKQQGQFDRYRDMQIAKRVGDAMLIEMVRRKILVPSQLGRALAEWDAPSHGEHAEQGYSMWRLHNAVTEALKPSDPTRNVVPQTWQRTTEMTKLLDGVLTDGYPIYSIH